MSTLLFTNRAPTPIDPEHVRSTLTVVDENDPPAVEEHAPEYNDAGHDPDTGGGLTTRQLASYVQPSVKTPPPTLAEANAEHNEIVNRRISSSGTAAQREAAGEWGHGTFKIIEGIEPVIRDGGAFGDTYFKADRPDFVSTSGVKPAPGDPASSALAARAAEDNSRKAVQASQYAAYLQAVTGIGG